MAVSLPLYHLHLTYDIYHGHIRETFYVYKLNILDFKIENNSPVWNKYWSVICNIVLLQALFAISFYGKYATVFLFAMILVTYSGSPLWLVTLYFISPKFTMYASSLFVNNIFYRFSLQLYIHIQCITRLYLYHGIGSFYLLIWASVLLLISLLRTKRLCHPPLQRTYT